MENDYPKDANAKQSNDYPAFEDMIARQMALAADMERIGREAIQRSIAEYLAQLKKVTGIYGDA